MYLTILSFITLYALYLYSKRNFNYWKKRGIKNEKPVLFVGGCLKQATDNVSMSGRFAKLYREHPHEKVVGFFQGNNPGLLVRNPELIKRVLVTDFRSFHYRAANFHKKVTENLMKNLFNVDGDIWKLMRQKLTPAFSSSKLKAMFPLITERAENLLKIAEEHAKIGVEVDIRELMARYTTDIIGACGFGIDADTLNDKESEFRKLGKNIFTLKFRNIMIPVLKLSCPKLFEKVHYFPPGVEEKTISLVKEIMSHRNYKPSGRNDFIDLMLELKQKGKIVGASIDNRNPDGSATIIELELDDVLLASQVFIFFAAGFETSSTASSFLLHMLAYNKEEQVLCQREIDQVLKKYDGKLSFDAVRQMKYLEMAFKESLRIFPSPGAILRKCVSSYTIPELNLTIDPETLIVIPIEALHMDEMYFEDPEQFKPERFHPDNINNMKKYVYMPFGEGPRACIGERMGIMQSLAGVAAILSKFSVAPSKNSVKVPLVDYKSNIIQVVVGGLPLTLRYRE